MYNITNTQDLNKAIFLLENELDEQKQLLTEQLRIMYRSYRPVNIIKDIFKEAVTSEEFRSNILTATMGISTGYLTKKLLFRNSNKPLKTLIGNLLQYGVANLFIHPSRILRSILFPLQEHFINKDEQRPGDV
jgi:hypothetical protein